MLLARSSFRTDRNKPPVGLMEGRSFPAVTFLVDENLPPSLVGELRKFISGHVIAHVQEMGLKGASDKDLKQMLLRSNNPIIITGDADFLSPQKLCRAIYIYSKANGDRHNESAMIATVHKNADLISAFASPEHDTDRPIMALPVGRRAPARRINTPIGQCRIPITDPIALAERFPSLFRKKLESNGWKHPVPYSMRIVPENRGP